MRKLLRSRKALSPVIATVILVSVTIVVAVSVAYWMGTIASSYTAFEQVELPTAYAEYLDELNGTGTPAGWKVHTELKNSGSADATIDNIFLNAKPLNDYASGVNLFVGNDTTASNEVINLDQIAVTILKGGSERLIIWIQDGPVDGCTHGTRIDLKFHSAAGLDYPAQVRLI